MRKSKAEPLEKNKTELAPFSLIFFLLDRLADVIYHGLCDGFFGKLFTAYSKEQAMFNEGFLKNHFSSGTKLRIYVRKLREYVSGSFESSFIINKLQHLIKAFLAISLKHYGNALFAFGAYTVLIYFIRLFVPGLVPSDAGVAITGLILCIISLPMMLSRDHVAGAVGKATITRALFVDAFGYREESFEARTHNSRLKSNLLILFGMLLGILTLYIHPLVILVTLTTAIGVVLILTSPEIGVLLAITLCPFFSVFQSPAIILGLVVLVTAISYCIKLIRGKRVLKMELMDLAVLVFMIMLYFSGAITAGGLFGFHEALLSATLMFGYFLVVNLMRTEQWLRRCVLALVGSGTVVAVIGIFQYVFGMVMPEAWVDTTYFSEIRGRATSVFENPNVLAFYLVMILPFALLAWNRAQGKKAKLVSFFSIATICLCTVLTWSRGAWLAMLISVLLFALIRSKKTLRWLFLLCFFVPFLPFLLPETVTKRFLSIGNLSDSSTMYRIYTWKGSIRTAKEYLVGGIGYGPTAYQEIYPQFAYAGIEAAEHSHNLYLQILIGMGIGGLLIFFAVLLLWSQMNLEYLKNAKDRSKKLMVASAVCAIVACLVMGIFDFPWYNYRVFFLFWSILAFSCACIRVADDEERRHSFTNEAEENGATMDISI